MSTVPSAKTQTIVRSQIRVPDGTMVLNRKVTSNDGTYALIEVEVGAADAVALADALELLAWALRRP